MGLTFEWDPKKAAQTLTKHGVSFEEASTVFKDSLFITIVDTAHSTADEQRLIAIGQSNRRKTLVVVHSERGDTIRIISARKANRNLLPEHDFSKGVRATEIIHVWAPLIGFRWTGSERQIADDTWIRPGSARRDYQKFAEFKYALAEEEWDRCREAEHWLALTHTRSDELSTKAKINSFLLALWIVRPTQTHVPFRFETAESGFRLVARVLDRFQWVEGQVADELKDQDLDEVTRILAPLRIVYAARRRLKNALALTFRGCVASDWQSTFICFSAAAEAILTYSKGPRLTDRLAESYAKLVSSSRSGRESAKDRFKRLYAIRSDIVHGRAFDRDNPSRNLSDLAEFSDVLRRLWRMVLESQEIRIALEGDDGHRQNFFRKLSHSIGRTQSSDSSRVSRAV